MLETLKYDGRLQDLSVFSIYYLFYILFNFYYDCCFYFFLLVLESIYNSLILHNICMISSNHV